MTPTYQKFRPTDMVRRVCQQRRLGFLMFVLLALAACAQPRGMMDEVERNSDTGVTSVFGTNLRVFHAALLDTSGIHLDFPGYLVGVEYLHGSAKPTITHIMGYKGSSAPEVVFQNFNDEAQPSPPSSLGCPKPPDNGAFNALAEQIRRRLREAGEQSKPKYTHLLFMVMGWNTDQTEAVRNFNQLATNISRATEDGEEFRPLVIGVSWPSMWKLSGWWIIPDAAVSSSSFWAKKDQADQLGRQILEPLLIKAVLKARSDASANIPIVMIGHSFGARALSAMFRPWQSAFREITPWDWDSCYDPEQSEAWSFKDGDQLVLLQGAVDISDVLGNKSILPSLLRPGSLTATMTASQFDSAVSTAFWANYIGNIETFRRACSASATTTSDYDIRYIRYISCGEAVGCQWGLERCHNHAADITLDPNHSRDSRTIYYQNASRLINCGSPFGGGGAHSDIFRTETGSFLWNEIQVQSRRIRTGSGT